LAAAPAAAAGTPKRGGTLVVAKTTEAPSLDPHRVNAVSRQRVTQNIYSYLVQADADLRIQPDLAEKWDIAADGKTYTFNLRRGAKFHNGREVQAADVKYSIERIKDPATASQGAGLLSSIDGVETPDPYTVRLILKQPDSGLLASLASAWGGIVAREEVEKANGDLAKSSAGSGPFILEEWIPNQTLKLRRNPDYYGQNGPYVDNLTFQVIPEESAIVAQLRSGSVDLAMLEDNKNFELVRDAANLDTMRGTRLGFDYLNIDNQREPFNKVEVRQALSYAIDRREILQVAASGYGSLLAPIPPAFKDYALDPETLEEYRPNLDKARQLLAQAGLPNGFSAELEAIPTFPTMVTGSQVIADQAKRVGINFEIKQYEYGVWLDRFNTKKFQTTMNVTGGNADPDTLLYNRLRSAPAGVSGVNQNNSSDPEIDRLLDEGKLITDLNRRIEHYKQVQRVLLQKAPQLWLFTPDLIHVMKKRVKGFESHPSTFMQGLVGAWIDG
jgi:peptide/nickel transport system substrate-binding protein